MNYEVVGIKKVDYFSRRKNKQVQGIELYLLSTEPLSTECGIGYVALPPIYFSSAKHSFNDFDLNDVVNVYYNRYGSVEDVIKV